MRKVLFFSVCLVALFALSSVSKADIYEMDIPTAALMYAHDWSDPVAVPANEIYYRGYNPGTSADKIAGVFNSYGAVMEYEVGFAGHLIIDTDLVNQPGDPTNQLASVKIGLADNIKRALLSGTYSGFTLPISNDDNQTWEYKLYAEEYGPSTYWESDDWTSVASGNQITLSLDFTHDVDFTNLKDIGFIVQFNKLTTGRNSNESDDYHTSVVPVPEAILLGLFGMSAAGLKLRKFA